MTPPRVAIYARYSSEGQNPLSVEDQVAACTRHAERRGWAVVATLHDAAISGQAMANRPGLQAALKLAEAGVYDILLAEDEDRIARNLEHQAGIYNKLTDLGITIATLSTDRVTLMHVAFKGFLSQEAVAVLSVKTKRGMRANAEKGLATGSRLYGYRSRPGGSFEVVAAEREVVRRIFRDYVAGQTGRQIADALNRERIPGPHGGWWNASTILGSPKRGNGVLRTELYAGVKVWNRFDMRKDRTTGKRISRAIPAEEWKRTPAPAWRILEPELWAAAQARLAARSHQAVRPEQLLRRPGLFSGLLRCRCGAAYTVRSTRYLRCAANAERGPAACANGRLIERQAIETRILDSLRRRLLSPQAVAHYVRSFHAALKERTAGAAERRRGLESRIAELTRRIERTLDLLILEERNDQALKDRLRAFEAERADLRRDLAQVIADEDPLAPIELHPRAADHYRAKIAALQAELAEAADRRHQPDRSLVEHVRELVDRIDILPTGDAADAPVELVLHGRLAPLLEGAETLMYKGVAALVAGGGIGRCNAFPAEALAIRMWL